MYALQISSISTAEPVTVDEAKSHLRIQTTVDDDLLDAYITAARQMAENHLKRALLDTQWELTIDDFYSSHIELPRGAPLSTKSTEVVVSYTKTTGDTTTLSDTCYTVEYRAEPGFVRLNYGLEWPTDVQDSAGAVRIVYRSGYTSAVAGDSNCPEAIKTWVKVRVGQMYEYREPLLDGQNVVREIPRDFVDGLLDPYRLMKV